MRELLEKLNGGRPLDELLGDGPYPKWAKGVDKFLKKKFKTDLKGLVQKNQLSNVALHQYFMSGYKPKKAVAMIMQTEEKVTMRKLLERLGGRGFGANGPGRGRGNPDEPGGRGMGPGGKGDGPSGQCVCPKCGHKEKHDTSKPCMEIECSKCGAKMDRAKDDN